MAKKSRPHEELERKWAAACSLDPAGMVACSSGTAALHLAFEALRLPAGAGVVMGDWNMISCARGASLAGLAPRFVDVHPDTLLIDGDELEDFIDTGVDEDAAAVLAAHLHGRRCNMDRLVAVAQGDGMYVVEDLAEAHGVPVHAESTAACWSFYRNKIVCGEEGGAVWFRDPAMAALARQLRSVGFTPEHDYTHVPRGHNYRLADLLARPILDSVGELEDNLFLRGKVAGWYDDNLPASWGRLTKHDAVWVYDVRVRGLTRAGMRAVVTGLRDEGVEARFGFLPLSSQEEYRRPGAAQLHRHSYAAAEEIFTLPVHPLMSWKEVVKACKLVEKLVDRLNLL